MRLWSALEALAWRLRFARHRRWMRTVHPARAASFAHATVSLERCPALSVVTPAWDGSPPAFLEALLGSVLAQDHDRFEWILVDDGTTSPASLRAYEDVVRRCARARVVTLPRREGIVGATVAGARAARNPWLVFADADDLLAPDALSSVARAAARPGTDFVYSDSDHVDARGRRYAPVPKPGPSPELALGLAYTCHLHAMSRAFFEANVEASSRLEGALDWDLLVRALERPERVEHVPRVLYSWRIHEGGHSAPARARGLFSPRREPTTGEREAAARLAAAQRAVLEGYLARRGIAAEYRVEPAGRVEAGESAGVFRIRWAGARALEVAALAPDAAALPDAPYVAWTPGRPLAPEAVREAAGLLEREPGVGLVGAAAARGEGRRFLVRREVAALGVGAWVARRTALEAAGGASGTARGGAGALSARVRAAGYRVVVDPELGAGKQATVKPRGDACG